MVADGALRNVLARIDAGAGAVLTANLSAISEAMIPALAKHSSGDILAIAPRDLMRLALDHLHPVVKANLADAPRHDPDANRMFWRAGTDALVGRLYLLHMAAIHPEVSDFIIAAPSDFALAEELVPAGRVDIVTDSDEYAVIEVVPESSGPRSVVRGSPSPATVAGSVRRWATDRQREHAARPVIFHAGDLPDIDSVVSASARFVAEVAARLPTEPMPVRHHPYWIGQLNHHRRSLIDAGGAESLPVLLGYDPATETTGRYRTGELRWLFLGHAPRVRPWHPRWPDVVALRRVLGEGRGKILLVGDSPGALRRMMPEAAVLSIDKLEATDPGTREYDRGALILRSTEDRGETLTAKMWTLLKPAATLTVITGDIFSDEVTGFAHDPGRARGVPLSRARAWVQAMMMRMASSAGRTTGVSLVVSLPALGALAIASLVLNVIAVAIPGGSDTPCSSSIMVLRNTRAETNGERQNASTIHGTTPSASPLLQGGDAR